jgi:hypothetical protein
MSVSSHAASRPDSGRPETTAHRDLPQQLTEVERHILQSLQHLRFGTLEIVVHDGRVVQVEKSEKLRFDAKGRAIAESLS